MTPDSEAGSASNGMDDDAVALAMADRSARSADRRSALAEFGERNPGATDWIRRDASELAWKERLKRDWAKQDGVDLDKSLAALGTTSADEDDWRVVEFDELLEREKNFRASLYRWWLGVWDASGDDYLFEPDEDDSVGWPATRFDGSSWDEPPRRSVTRALPEERRRRRPLSYYDEEEEDRSAEDMVYGGRPRRMGSHRVSSGRRRRGIQSNDDDDERDELDEVGEYLGRRRRRARRGASSWDDDDDEEEEDDESERDYDEDGGGGRKPRRRLFSRWRERWKRWRGRDDQPARARRSNGSRKRRARDSDAPTSRVDYVSRRLAGLHERVSERIGVLQDEESELLDQREEATARLRQIRSQIERTGEVVADDATAIETRGDRTQYRTLEAKVAELRARRDRVWDSIDEAEARLDEIDSAQRTLKRRGLAGLRGIVRRKAVSRSLITYLEKLL